MTKVKAAASVPTGRRQQGARPPHLDPNYPSPVQAGHVGTLAADVHGLRDERGAGVASPGHRGPRIADGYGSVEAVSGIDLEVHRGEVFAFLGPNGAGKTTTVEILEGFRHRSGARSRSWVKTRPELAVRGGRASVSCCRNPCPSPS